MRGWIARVESTRAEPLSLTPLTHWWIARVGSTREGPPSLTPLLTPHIQHTTQTALSAQFVAAITLGLLLALVLLLAGALDPVAIPWWVWAGVLFYLAVRQQMETYSPGSLVRAARDGDVRLVKKFLALEHGRYALELDDKGYSPLMRASARGSLEIVGGLPCAVCRVGGWITSHCHKFNTDRMVPNQPTHTGQAPPGDGSL